ncbi:hypothetical protein PAXRUDRAFT_8427 [Paxillus rubicundulus Ve08.2h10]|uniref:Uncharacterized protein n=1 Tax=Paxillus rubicundulus Ve08.2h10 TaxID=930991 RepID=A0A0D0ECX6_9AGAM|nr:hypothetical protein PAXRUDRAFT_8427 [Paxillus rubicundulus Ve08.2h10]
MSGSDGFGSSPEQISFPTLFSEQFSDEEIVWTRDGSDGSHSDGDFILLGHPLPNVECEGDWSSAFEKLSFGDHLTDSECSSEESDSNVADLKKGTPSTNRRRQRSARNVRRPAQAQSDVASDRSDYRHGIISIPTASYDDASAFITHYLESPVKDNEAQLTLLRALIVELGIRVPTTSDLPSTLTSARKILKAEVHINIKEYIATRHKGQSALRQILKPSKKALRKDIRKKGNRASLKWVKGKGLQALLVTCFI